MKTIYLAGGCFWGLEKYLEQFDGIEETEVGYANGPDQAPTYEEVCADSGHAETVKVFFDEKVLPLEDLLQKYLLVIDPYSVNRQGGDAGIQYRTGIYSGDKGDLEAAERALAALKDESGKEPAVEVLPLKNFFPAEEYHQKYLDKNPGGYCHIPQRLLSMEKPSLRGETSL